MCNVLQHVYMRLYLQLQTIERDWFIDGRQDRPPQPLRQVTWLRICVRAYAARTHIDKTQQQATVTGTCMYGNVRQRHQPLSPPHNCVCSKTEGQLPRRSAQIRIQPQSGASVVARNLRIFVRLKELVSIPLSECRVRTGYQGTGQSSKVFVCIFFSEAAFLR